ncbi:threonylcarbamoyl-AMP synthase [Onthophagus taurus]|uniref:threonylcarbamoyl-AMP synthase n=1 Tax=Onthophagus taurus TaxID=166361 RepID=UPI0039BEA846
MRSTTFLYNLIKSVDLNLKLKMAQIVSVNDIDAVQTAIEILKSGEVIALPTDTVYGLACCATNIEAVNKLYEIKARNENKPVAICVGRENDVKKWAEVSHLPNGLLKSLLPGPVTLVLNCARKLDKSLNFDGKIGVRIPDYDFIRNVCDGLNSPIALTSANFSGDPSSVRIEEFKGLWAKIGGIFDGGILGVGDSNRGASTVVDLSKVGYFKVMRNGIAFESTRKILIDYGIDDCTVK